MKMATKQAPQGMEAIWRILGQETSHSKHRTRLEVHDYLLNHRLPFEAIQNLSNVLNIDLFKNGPGVFGIGARTLARRRQSGRLLPQESIMVFLMAGAVVEAVDAFDDIDKAIRWFHKPCRSLRGNIPLYMLRDDLGRGLIGDVLGQIKYVLYS